MSSAQQRFRQVAEWVRTRIDAGVLGPGDKLPSLRRLAGETGFSVVTVYRAYELLEAEGICHSRDRSGFYVAHAPAPAAQRFSPTLPVMPPDNVRALDSSLAHLHATAGAALLPAIEGEAQQVLATRMRRALLQAPTALPTRLEGDPELIAALVQRAGYRGIFCPPEHVLLARSAMEALNLCLDSLAANGPVLVESPAYYPVLESLRHRKVQALEIYSHPQHGIDAEQFEHILASTGVKTCVLMGNSRVPTGVAYSRDTLERLVHAAQRHCAVILENDITGELGYSELATPTLKRFDIAGNVLQFGGSACWLGPAYEMGWVLAGQHAPRLRATCYLGATHLPHPALQRALAGYLNSRPAQRHLRQTCQHYEQRMRHGIHLLHQWGAGKLWVSAPSGGYLCWVRGPRGFKAMELAMAAREGLFSFIPGPFFSPAGGFGNFMALNFSAEWSPARAAQLQRLVEAVVSPG